MGLDPLAIARLNRLTRVPGVEVVISSTWRHGKSRVQLCDILADRGFVGVVRGMTPDLARRQPESALYAGRERGDEIQSWLDMNSPHGPAIESFCIIDDSGDMGHLLPRLVRTSFDFGLLDEHVERAAVMLGVSL